MSGYIIIDRNTEAVLVFALVCKKLRILNDFLKGFRRRFRIQACGCIQILIPVEIVGYHLHGDTYAEIIIIQEVNYVLIKIICIYFRQLIEIAHILEAARFHIRCVIA